MAGNVINIKVFSRLIENNTSQGFLQIVLPLETYGSALTNKSPLYSSVNISSQKSYNVSMCHKIIAYIRIVLMIRIKTESLNMKNIPPKGVVIHPNRLCEKPFWGVRSCKHTESLLHID